MIIYAQLDFNQDWGFPRRYFLIFLFFIKSFPTVVVYLKFLIRITKKISCLLSKGSTVSEKNILKGHYSYGPICPVVVSYLGLMSDSYKKDVYYIRNHPTMPSLGSIKHVIDIAHHHTLLN